MKMNAQLALSALKKLDELLALASFQKVTLAVGGGGSMMIQYGFAGVTVDIDAIPTNAHFDDLKPFISEVAQSLGITPDWLNPHYGTYTVYLSPGASGRMHTSFTGKVLTVKSLSAEDLMVMKLMANRAKDLPHIRHLLKNPLDLSAIEDRLIELKKLFPAIADRALERFYEETEDV